MAERQISGGVGLVFKGSGFYVTDYKRAGEKREGADTKPAAAPESKPSSETKSSSESKSSPESKAAAEAKPAERTKKKKDSGDK
jgi:predicted nucleic acid-binding Zn ribbon protein